jgi:hypothetical protein
VVLVKFLEKNQNLHIQIGEVSLNMTTHRTIKKKKKWKKMKTQDSMGKINFFFGTLPFSPWEILATWLHIGAL